MAGGLILHGGPTGEFNRGPLWEPGGSSFAGTFDRQEKHIWVPFLDPEAINILSLEAIWNFSKGTGLS